MSISPPYKSLNGSLSPLSMTLAGSNSLLSLPYSLSSFLFLCLPIYYLSIHLLIVDLMDARKSCDSLRAPTEEEVNIRRGPWSVEEDLVLSNYIAKHGEGRWNSLARCAGLKRTGKSCRLRWLNYLRPDVRRGNITPQEQLTILELHSRWGNRWSKIAQLLPGRTDNEIKNYWRTRVQKYAKQLQCDVNSKHFKDTMRHVWMPRLAQRVQAAMLDSKSNNNNNNNNTILTWESMRQTYGVGCAQENQNNTTPEQSRTVATSDSSSITQVVSPVSCLEDGCLQDSKYNEDAQIEFDYGLDGLNFSVLQDDMWFGEDMLVDFGENASSGTAVV